MNRRTSLLIMAMSMGEAMAFDAVGLKKLVKKVKGRVFPPRKPLPESARRVVVPPSLTPSTSVESALNSRCTSDYDSDPYNFHWGMFDGSASFGESFAASLAELIVIPRLTRYKTGIAAAGNTLTFTTESPAGGLARDHMMIESGMQQQAVSLLCAACGIGMNFRSCGNDGTLEKENVLLATRIVIGPMLPSYDGVFWSDAQPGKVRPWRSGNLPDPRRKGGKPLIGVLSGLSLSGEGSEADRTALGQLLWACRGRTPHYYKSEPWGMTIPVSHGEQEISKLKVADAEGVHAYVNMSGKLPTHSLLSERRENVVASEAFTSLFGPGAQLLVLAGNDSFERALWEVGYCLLNLLVQAKSLEVKYRTVLFNDEQIRFLESKGITRPVAGLLL